MKAIIKNVSLIFLVILSLALGGCHSEGILAPKGEIAFAEYKLIFFAIGLMLIVVIPTIFMALYFGWRYREKNNAHYAPEWRHNTLLEVVWWGIPCIIILILGTVTWKTTHSLDPFKPLNSQEKPVLVEVVSLDWKWLFIYPEYKIATVNYLRLPTGRPIDFKITAAAPMNSFVIPQLGGQIYAMTGMTTQLHLITDIPGSYRGFGANYTGVGFAGMQFTTDVSSPEDFADWVKTAQKKPDSLTPDVFWNRLVPPSTENPVAYFGKVSPGLFDDIVMSYMMPGMGDNARPNTHTITNPINH